MYNQQAQSRWFTNNQWSLIMNYNSPKEISIGDKVLYKDIQCDVLINYIKGEIDRKGYNPPYNYSILIDNNDNRITCLDYKQLDVIELF